MQSTEGGKKLVLHQKGLKDARNKAMKDHVMSLSDLYHNHCKGDYLYNCGLHNESYFKYFNYPDFITPYSGLIQIRKYSELQADVELLNRLVEIGKLAKAVRQEIYRLLVVEFGYFE